MSCPHCSPKSDVAVLDTPTSSGGEKTIVLVGNPNVGKSTLFNAITGSRQHVVNAPGTTVEMKRGTWRALGANLVDLPGTYSLIASSPDEQVVSDTLSGAEGSFTDPRTGRKVDLAIVLLDASAMTRSLYLLGQVAQAGHPVVAVATMVDVSEKDGQKYPVDKLADELGIPVLAVDPRHYDNPDLLEGIVSHALEHHTRPKGLPVNAADGSCTCGCGGLTQADELFAWVDRVETAVVGKAEGDPVLSTSDKIDRVLLNPWLGIPIFFVLMWFLFKVAGEWVSPVQDFFDHIFSSTDEGFPSLANGITYLLTLGGLQDGWLHSFLIGGLCTGLGVVSSFIPLMFIIFLMISILEDSGYMARAAFLGDRIMRAIGLDGRVILPLIMGFGCNLPSLAATRTLPNTAQRIVTTIITPYTSCAARLTIYLMIARIFFPDSAGTVIFSLYVLSLLMVVLGALILKPFFTKKTTDSPLFLVLPAYQVPRVFVILRTTWLRAWAFVTGAGKIILAMTFVVWLMGAIPMAGNYSFADSELPMEDSLYGRTAQVLEPVFKPAGFGEWHMTGALMTGFVAKETVISSIVTSYNMDPETEGGDAEDGGDDLGSLPQLVTESFQKSAGDAAPIGAFAFLVFVLTYTPCMATVAEQVRQIGGKLTAAAVAVQLCTAWLLAVGVFQIGRLLF